MATKLGKRNYKEIIENFIWPKGTYGERPPNPSIIIRENMDKIREVQEVVKLKMSRKNNSSKHKIKDNPA